MAFFLFYDFRNEWKTKLGWKENEKWETVYRAEWWLDCMLLYLIGLEEPILRACAVIFY